MGFDIVGGWFPPAMMITGILALLALLAGRGRTWWRHRVPLAAVAASALTTVITLVTNHLWHPFADALPTDVVAWLGLTLLAVGLAVVRPASVPVRLLAVAGVLLVGVVGAAQVNADFGAYPTLGALLGRPLPGQVDSASIIGRSEAAAPVPGGRPLADAWAAPAGLPTTGEVTEVSIPGVTSAFPANGAWVYLPPAYQASPRPLLPVLILLAGQPGDARNWFDGGRAAQTMDAYAAAHHGLAPVVVVPDWVGSTNGNPMCVDSAVGGNDYTYLTVDLPNWIRTNLETDTRPTRWAVGGLSAGATCALQLATNDPAQFPTFLFFSGQTEPTLDNRDDTVATLFEGDQAAFTRINPMDIMSTTSFTASAGVFVAGDQDPDYGPQTAQMAAAATAAGMAVSSFTVPGGHEFPVWAAALSSSMDWLGRRLGMTG